MGKRPMLPKRVLHERTTPGIYRRKRRLGLTGDGRVLRDRLTGRRYIRKLHGGDV